MDKLRPQESGGIFLKKRKNVVAFDEEKADVMKEVYRRLNRVDVHTEQITVKETHLGTQRDGSVASVEQAQLIELMFYAISPDSYTKEVHEMILIAIPKITGNIHRL